MSFLDAIANFGIASRGYDDADQRIRSRDRSAMQDQVTARAVEEALRKDDVAKQARAAMKGLPVRGAVRGEDIVTPSVNDPYEEHARVDKGLDLPESVDVAGQMKSAADVYSKEGDFEQAEKYRKALKAMEDEGYKSVVVGIAAGKDPTEIATAFNEVGKKRITGGTTDGKTYRFKFEDGTEQVYDREKTGALATQMGFLKKPDLHNVPAGSTVLSNGQPVYTAPTKPTPRNIDPLSPEGIEAKKKFADYEAKLKSMPGEKATELQRNVAFLVEKGIAADEADAFGKLRTSMSRDRGASVAQLMNMLKPATFMGRSEQVHELKKKAEDLYDALHPKVASTPPTTPAQAPPREPPKSLKAPGGKSATFTGRYTAAGKPIYSDGTNTFVAE